MRGNGRLLVWALLVTQAIAARGQNAKELVQQNAKEIVQQDVQMELVASRDDHSRWLYYEIDSKPGSIVEQWVADTGHGSLRRVIREFQPTHVHAWGIPAAIGVTMSRFKGQRLVTLVDMPRAGYLQLLQFIHKGGLWV